MNRKQAKSLWPLIKAFSEGKTIQYRRAPSSAWKDTETPAFDNCHNTRYRIKHDEPSTTPSEDSY